MESEDLTGEPDSGGGMDVDASWIQAKNRGLRGADEYDNVNDDDDDDDDDDEGGAGGRGGVAGSRSAIKSRAAAQAASGGGGGGGTASKTSAASRRPVPRPPPSAAAASPAKPEKPRVLTVPEVAPLAAKELRTELRLRGLETGGLKHHLTRRLEEAVAKEQEARGEGGIGGAGGEGGAGFDVNAPPPVAPVIVTGNRLDVELLDFKFTPNVAQVPFGCAVHIQVSRDELPMVEYQLSVTKVGDKGRGGGSGGAATPAVGSAIAAARAAAAEDWELEEDCCVARSPALLRGGAWQHDFLEMPGTYCIADSSYDEGSSALEGTTALTVKVQSTPGWQETRAKLVEQKLRRRKAEAAAEKVEAERRKVSENARRAEEERKWREAEEARVEREAELDKADPGRARRRAEERAEAVGESVSRIRAGSGGAWRSRIEKKTQRLQAKREEMLAADAVVREEEAERRRVEEARLETRRQRRLVEQREREAEVEVERERLRLLDEQRSRARAEEEEKLRQLREATLTQQPNKATELIRAYRGVDVVEDVADPEEPAGGDGGDGDADEQSAPDTGATSTTGMGEGGAEPPASGAADGGDGNAGGRLSGSARLVVEDGEFSPARREVACGTIIEFVVSEDEPGTMEYEFVVSAVSTFDESSEEAGEGGEEVGRSEILTPGESWSHIFEAAGLYVLSDPDAPDLRLEVTVVADDD